MVNTYILAPETCECYFTWRKSECHLMLQKMSFKDLEKRRVFWVIQVDPVCNHRCPCKREAEGDRRHPQRGGHVPTEAEIGEMRPQAQEAWSHQGLDEVGRTLPWGLVGYTALMTSWCWTSGLQTVRDACCLKLPGLWCFAASALNANVVPDVHQHGDSQVHIFLSFLCFIRIVAKSRTFCPWSSIQVIKMNNMCA